MVSGSMSIPVFLGAVITPSGDVYSQSVMPIPEPSAFGMLIVAGAPVLMLRRQHLSPAR
jgi:hypothetical protein